MLPINIGAVRKAGISLGSFPFIVTSTVLDNEKEVLIVPSFVSHLDFSHCFARNLKQLFWPILSVCFTILILFFFFVKSPNIRSSLILAVQPALSFISVLPLIFRLQTEKGKRTAKYHSAKHMVENAYKKLGRVPTLEEIRLFSRFSVNCETLHDFNTIFAFTPGALFFFLLYTDSLIFLLGAIFLCPFWSLMVYKFKLGRYLQFIVTSKPTDQELLVAIKCLQELEILCQSHQISNDIIYIDTLP